MFILNKKGFRQIPNRRAFRPLRRFNNTNRPNPASHDYLLKIVPTIYEDLSANRRYPYQFTFFYRVRTPPMPRNVLQVQIDNEIKYFK